MNKNRRKRLLSVIDKLDDAMCEIDNIKSEEECAYDILPESLQFSDKGETMQSIIDTLDTASGYVQDAIADLNDIAV